MDRRVLILLTVLVLMTGCSSASKKTGSVMASNDLLLSRPYKTDRYSCLVHATEAKSVVNNSVIQAAYRKCMLDRGYTEAELKKTTSPYF